MSRASSHALKHPPVTAPSEPAGAPSPFPNSPSRSIASGGAAAARNPMPAAASRPRRGSPSTTAGRASRNCRRSRPRSTLDTARKVITRNDSPDIGFDRSINPYRGCEHGCVYCFARPTHAYLGLSPGLDFESKLFAKPDAPALLEKELAAPDYEPRMIAIGTNTDPYQPIERERKIMRGILEVLERAGHPGRHRHQVGAGRRATSIFSRGWPSAISPRSRFR